jgi:hypothetical protein
VTTNKQPDAASGGSTPDWADDAPYGYSVRVAKNFEAVLDKDAPEDDIGVAGLAEVLRRWACVLLQARGGAGKTYTAERVQALLADDGVWSVLIPAVHLVDVEDLSSWGPGQWAEADPDGVSEEGRARIQAAWDGAPGLIVIDGLNEVDRRAGQRILEAVAPMTAVDPQVSFLITDRLARRAGVSRHWGYATLGLVPLETARQIAGPDATDAMRIPYYLKRHSQGRAAHEILRESVSRFVDAEGVARLAAAAFDCYKRFDRRVVDRLTVEDAVGAEVWDTLVEARCVLPERLNLQDSRPRPDAAVAEVAQHAGGETGDVAPVAGRQFADDLTRYYRFEHHLLHDFLAGLHLATHPELWTEHGFDVVTLKASSPDALALALTQVVSTTDAEDLVQAVYNWNYYAAAYMLEEDRAGRALVSDALALTLLGALAEKRFDGIVATATRVEDALRVTAMPLGRLLLDAADRDGVVAVVKANLPWQQPAWFEAWLEQFARPDGAPATPADIVAVTTAEPVVGWGAANALRRFDISKAELEPTLRSLLKDESSTVRWRATHAIGPHPSPGNLTALRETLSREPVDSWVAYGALRAQFEQIRSMPAIARPALLHELARDLTPILNGPDRGFLRIEVLRCLEVEPLPENWHRDIEPVLNLLWDTSDDRGAADLAAMASRLRERKKEAQHVA